mmetsp:Transcript_33239/g.67778  ORF Transcript_33239/g.67778 Transcript_33239/m.67778 type:complete len:278 (-) Transcript_33239:271-1104(-)|eukprot:CAMPEP_0113420046 /NCGR_PEP_ID=MMETSP0013_2-20120614/27120_1 /TAXON_ID=2843 ORGANISM="Skeletonema costatum, Strain 1716" /NCGR_SAMPLE_ID=MMETSP0013_2 /ASSEMBLY_ACC=CAM_ASM_000158 /LENGTH=277 /DNA_ID=CAMNT_0000307501 /DNA_START=79 /DNA_END=912 /DNA_ORIENTATION=+ /assembly_acc=CAM_ASM_000158
MSLIYTSPTSRHNIYLGGKLDAKSFSTLKQRNVVRILNVTPAKETGITAGVPNYFEQNKSGLSIKYKRISVYDASTSDLLSYAEEMVNFISSGLHHGSVLVHCQRGVSRSATAVIFYLIRKANMTYEQALQLCKQRRSTVDPNAAFCEQLKRYEQECRELGYLSATDAQNNDYNAKNGSCSESSECAKEQNTEFITTHTETKIVGSKRQVEASSDRVVKRQMVGPSIGPSIGPSKPIGPSRPTSIGPQIAAKPSQKTAPIGPQRPPTEENVAKSPTN